MIRPCIVTNQWHIQLTILLARWKLLQKPCHLVNTSGSHSTAACEQEESCKSLVQQNVVRNFIIAAEQCTWHAGVLELVDFIRRENIKTLVEHIIDQHLER